jgi:deazaflavin-dependent oxidoreductase (nitroreductase family)
VTDTFDEQVISEFRARGGVVSGLQDLSLLLLHRFGAKSGSERVTPLAFWSVSDNAVAVLASNRGAPQHPDWYYNLVAHPTTTVEIGAEVWSVRARVAAPEERRKMTDRLVTELGAARREPAEQLRAERQAQLRRIRDLAGVTT